VAEPGDVDALQAMRQRGAAHFDPVRFHAIESLARRAGTRDGQARALIDARVMALLAAYRADFERSGGPAAPAAPAVRAPGPLAVLLDELAAQATQIQPQAASGAPASGASGSGELPGMRGRAAPPELKSLHYFRGTWSRLSAERKLTQSQARLPENAGPLHSHRLMHRALTLMRTLSPAYLERFMGYVETLQWLDQAQQPPNATDREAPRAKAARKPARGARR
jgi:hypothetical protein